MGFRFSPVFANMYSSRLNTGGFSDANFVLMSFLHIIMKNYCQKLVFKLRVERSDLRGSFKALRSEHGQRP